MNKPAITRNHRKCTLVKIVRFPEHDIILKMFILRSRYWVIGFDIGNLRRVMKANGGWVPKSKELTWEEVLFDDDVRKFWIKSFALDWLDKICSDIENNTFARLTKV